MRKSTSSGDCGKTKAAFASILAAKESLTSAIRNYCGVTRTEFRPPSKPVRAPDGNTLVSIMDASIRKYKMDRLYHTSLGILLVYEYLKKASTNLSDSEHIAVTTFLDNLRLAVEEASELF